MTDVSQAAAFMAAAPARSSQRPPCAPAPVSRERSRTPAPTPRQELLERLQSLRALLPAFAEETAIARRQAASLRAENRELLERIRVLQRRLARAERRATPRSGGRRAGSGPDPLRT